MKTPPPCDDCDLPTTFAGNIDGLAAHLEHMNPAHPFSACMEYLANTDYSDAEKRAICGKVKSLMPESQKKGMSAAAPTIDIEVFAPGQWAGLTWTTKHLDTMVENFPKFSHAIKPMVKLGHDSKQFLAQKDGQPALGWVSALKRVGSKLVATISDMPELMRDLVKNRRYDRLSIEAYPHVEDTNVERNLKTGATGPALCAVSLLGADAPEVATLEDLHTALATEGGEVRVTLSETTDEAVLLTAVADDPAPIRGDARLAREIPPPKGRTPMADKTPKADDGEVATLQAQLKAEQDERLKLSEQVAELSALKTQNAQLADLMKALQDKAAAAERKAILADAEQFIARHATNDNFRITPGMRPLVTALFTRLGTEPIVSGPEVKLCFGEADTREAASARDLLVALIEAIPPTKLGPAALVTSDEPGRADGFGDAVREMAAKQGLDLNVPGEWDKAVRLTMAARRDLTADYVADLRRGRAG